MTQATSHLGGSRVSVDVLFRVDEHRGQGPHVAGDVGEAIDRRDDVLGSVGVQVVSTRYREDLCLLAGEAIEAGGTPAAPIDPVR